MTESVILIALVTLTLAFVTVAMPRAIKHHYAENVKVLASPL